LLLKNHVKLADLGLARLMGERSFTGTSCGSPAYMAPEVWRGRAMRQSDQYSLAASYVQMRRNRALFTNENLYEIMLAHFQQAPDLSDLPAAERQVLLKALAKEPAQRFPTCLEFVRALQKAVDGAKATVREQCVPQHPWRRRVLWAAGVAAL